MEFIHSITGSRGNISFLSDGKTLLQIDCGFNIKTANIAVNYQMSSVNGVLITHSHRDHSKFTDEYLNAGKACYMPLETRERRAPCNYYAKTPKPLKTFLIGSMAIMPFELPHKNTDGTDCQNYGYLIYSVETKQRVLWATDCQYIPQKFPPCEYYCIECNYFESDEITQEDTIAVEKRRLKSHMSVEGCILFLERQDLSKAKQIRLLHVSQTDKSTRSRALKAVREKFKGIEVVM